LRLGEAIEIDTRNLSGLCHGKALSFTRREMEILQYLNANTDRAVPREELLNRVWGYAKHLDIETRTVDIHIAKLRRKIEPDPAQPRHLVTVRGAGYRLLMD
jgi:two-component system alkaline phosphatase synthesis response regulator PhoP